RRGPVVAPPGVRRMPPPRRRPRGPGAALRDRPAPPPATPPEVLMTVPELNLPEDAVKIAALVAAEFAKHKVHARREFAGELAANFRELKYSNPDDDPRVRAYNRA